MKKSKNIRYLTHEGIKNIGTNRLMSVASVAVLMSCLVMIGCAVLLFLNIDSLLQTIEAQNVIMVFVDKTADEETVKAVEQQLKNTENVADVTYVPKEEAYETVLDSLGENASVLNGVDDSFLPDGFKVTVADMQAFAATVAAVKQMENVMSVQENSDLAGRLDEIRTAVTYVCIGIVALLFLVAVFIIANTVRITMFTRKLEISIMKAVGATNWFIRWPFLIEGVTIGIISAFTGIVVLFLIYFFASDALLTIFGVLGGSLVDFWHYCPYLLAAFLIISVLTGGIGSIISIGRYLKEQGSVIDNK